MTVTVEVEAASSIASMDRVTEAFKRSFGQHIQNITLDLTAEAKKESPIDTGFLRASILPTKDGDFEYTVGVYASYASLVHDGTRFIKPNPYMSRARLTVIARWSARGFQIV